MFFFSYILIPLLLYRHGAPLVQHVIISSVRVFRLLRTVLELPPALASRLLFPGVRTVLSIILWLPVATAAGKKVFLQLVEDLEIRLYVTH